ncbi:hypothetical protein SAY87_015122 [Trapa incisa]|uniref:Protein NUCLEAR FUSION DEFECTIVE 6, chloroplastic/mitochondrial n=1 Tax=Trapa incisa TaxID=236973 RepID=A0AAN7JDU6_9MYRT|nr:hypothetical protein SAY87_015122 [Trapa incisa]
MASACGRFVRRASAPLNSAIRSNLRPASTSRSPGFALPSKSTSTSGLSFSVLRVRKELGCVQSLLPLHSVVAAARMTSCLSTTSRSCRALSQGTLCCTSPDL